MSGEKILFVTGRLAEQSLRDVVAGISAAIGFDFEIAVPGIQVAALLNVRLLSSRLQVPVGTSRVVLPGWVQGDFQELEVRFGVPFQRGPRDLRDLPEFFGLAKRRDADLSKFSIEIIAEINHATRLHLEDIVREARSLQDSGADLIDVGSVPGESSPRIAEIVRTLKSHGHRVSIDSFEQSEVEQAVSSGAELILSCNHSNVDWVTQYGVEVVAIPDSPTDEASLDRLIEKLSSRSAAFRIDPILEPIGSGFTASIDRYVRFRRRYPDCPMMMGVGNVTELTEVDSAGVNMLLAAICEELGIQSVLTTQVINWCRTSVAELNAARRILHYSMGAGVVPKHISSALVMLRDARLKKIPSEELQAFSEKLTDRNFRIFSESGDVHLMNSAGYWKGRDVFELFSKVLREYRSSMKSTAESVQSSVLSEEHAFYLGYEMAKAEIALQLGKQYTQDQPLAWGLLNSGSDYHQQGSSHCPEGNRPEENSDVLGNDASAQ